ncbi:hypothetical protein Tco_1326693 [Tanacetum coccineum]
MHCYRLPLATLPTVLRNEIRESTTATYIGGFRADYDEIAEEIPATDMAELCQRMTDFVTTVRHDTYEIYVRLDDAQDDRSLMSFQLNLLNIEDSPLPLLARLRHMEMIPNFSR